MLKLDDMKKCFFLIDGNPNEIFYISCNFKSTKIADHILEMSGVYSGVFSKSRASNCHVW